MTTLRLLLWLRWKLFLRSGTSGSRIGGAALTLLMLVAFAPAWLGGALAAYWGVVRAGTVYGGGQLTLSAQSVTWPFIWVPNSNEGTVSKVDVRTGAELARYVWGEYRNSTGVPAE